MTKQEKRGASTRTWYHLARTQNSVVPRKGQEKICYLLYFVRVYFCNHLDTIPQEKKKYYSILFMNQLFVLGLSGNKQDLLRYLKLRMSRVFIKNIKLVKIEWQIIIPLRTDTGSPHPFETHKRVGNNKAEIIYMVLLLL